ncbi:MAG: glycosyl hydrolase family 18 protein [Clostridia bacterium]|nr:glycosyl hydrolase family 18 protein [Clostridia bacterium]
MCRKNQRKAGVFTLLLLIALTVNTFLGLSSFAGSVATGSGNLASGELRDVGQWTQGKSYIIGDYVSYNGSIYKCTQPHIAQAGWEPDRIPALWEKQTSIPTVTEITATGTPIPVATVAPNSGFKMYGYIAPDFIYSDAAAPIVKAGFKVEIANTNVYAVTNSAGYFEISNVPAYSAIYTLKISKDNYLYREIKNVPLTGNVKVGTESAPVDLWAGDMTIQGVQDYAINMTDILEIVGTFNSAIGDGKYKEANDLNRDNAVNMTDILIIIQHFNKIPGDYPNFPVAIQTPSPSPTATPTPTTTAPKEYRIVGYLSGWGSWSASTVAADKLTHINYAFAQISNGSVVGGNATKFSALRSLKQTYPHLKTLISIGGWAAEGFSDAALTDASRTKFADSAISFMKTNGFDGIDLDWEYPCSSEAGIKSRPEDKHNFTLMLQKIREKLNALEVTDGKKYLLTIATGAAQEYVNSIEFNLISGVLDFVNIMTYDFHNGVTTVTGHHTNLYTSSYDNGDKMSAEKGVTSHLAAGVPANKLVLGVAFYGRGWVATNTANNGLYQPVSSGSGGEYPYNSLVANYINKGGYIRFWDDSAKAPYLWNGSRFITYDDPESLGHKTSFIKSKGLGGAMFWEYTQDNAQALLNTLYTGLKQ